METNSDIANEVTGVFGALTNQFNDWINTVISGLPELLAAIIIFGIFFYLSKWARLLTIKIFTKLEAPRSLANLFATIAKILVLVIGVMIALGVLNLDKTVTSMLAGLGIVGVALGFAFQDIAANFISGILLIFRKPFEIGDVIEVNDITGVVERVDIRTTIIRTFQGQLVHVPNQMVFQNAITNYSEFKTRRIDLEVGVGYESDLDQVEHLFLEAINRLDYVKTEPVPMLHFESFGESSIDLTIRFWFDFTKQPDFLTARSEAIKAVKKVSDDNDIVLPFPITSIDLIQQGSDKSFK